MADALEQDSWSSNDTRNMVGCPDTLYPGALYPGTLYPGTLCPVRRIFEQSA